MPQEFERCRLQLIIEYNRVLAWGETVGLIHDGEGCHLASSLGTNAIELCSIVAHIGWLLEEFKELNDRWKGGPYGLTSLSDTLTTTEEADLSVQISNLALKYEGSRYKRNGVTELRRIGAWTSRNVSNARKAFANPVRARWVMVDKAAFEDLLKDIHDLTERLHELMSDYHGKQLREITARTYREMVVVRSDLCEIKSLICAVSSMMKDSAANHTRREYPCEDNDATLRNLLQLKEIKYIVNEILQRVTMDMTFDYRECLRHLVIVDQYDTNSFEKAFTSYKGERDQTKLDPSRCRGKLWKHEKDIEVWTEWRTVQSVALGAVESAESNLRTAMLAQMLSIGSPHTPFLPTCVGYVDQSEKRSRFGWMFQMPEGSIASTQLKTLHSILGQKQYKPNLVERVSLARNLASSLLHIHTADWLHKGVHSGNVIFRSDAEILDIRHPILSGFEFSRPESGSTTSRSLDPKWDIYRWPSIQNEVPRAGNSRQTYDIYSLGLLLLEIAHWQPLNKLMSLKIWPDASAQDCRIRGWLLNEEPFPPFKDNNPLVELRDVAGDKYWEATRCCLVAHGEGGMRLQELDEPQSPLYGLKLQASFTELVLQRLQAVSV